MGIVPSPTGCYVALDNKPRKAFAGNIPTKGGHGGPPLQYVLQESSISERTVGAALRGRPWLNNRDCSPTKLCGFNERLEQHTD